MLFLIIKKCQENARKAGGVNDDIFTKIVRT